MQVDGGLLVQQHVSGTKAGDLQDAGATVVGRDEQHCVAVPAPLPPVAVTVTRFVIGCGRFYSWCADADIPELTTRAKTIKTCGHRGVPHDWLTDARTEGTNRLIKQVNATPAGSGTGTTTAAEYGCTAPGDPADCQRGIQRRPPKIEELPTGGRPVTVVWVSRSGVGAATRGSVARTRVPGPPVRESFITLPGNRPDTCLAYRGQSWNESSPDNLICSYPPGEPTTKGGIRNYRHPRTRSHRSRCLGCTGGHSARDYLKPAHGNVTADQTALP